MEKSFKERMSSETTSQTDCELPAASTPVTKPQAENLEEPPRKLLSVPQASCQVASEMDIYGQNELHRAAEIGNVEKVKELLDRGFNTCSQDEDGNTPLHSALWNKQETAAEILADAGFYSNNIRDAAGWTPFHIAAMRGYVGVLRNLVAGGGNMHLQIIGGRTPLHFALNCENEAAAEFLVDIAGTNDIQDSNKLTPLGIAATAEYLGIVKKLLLSGVYPHVKAVGGQYILERCLKRGREAIAKMILAMCAWKNVAINYCEMRLWTEQVQFCKKVLSECQVEIERMRCTKLDGTNLTYYELAWMHVSRITPKLASEAIRQVLDSDRVTADFPYYIELMAFRVRKAESRRSLANQCLEFSSVICPPLPSSIMDIVLLYLDEQDMRNIISACKFRN